LGNPAFVAQQFTAIVWKGTAPANKFKVAFARRFNYVAAWYCPAGTGGINSGSALANVARETCPKKCTDDLTNDRFLKCYQTAAGDAHNARRKEHLVPELTIDYDLAKQAQVHAQTYANGGTPPAPPKNCSRNYRKAPLLATAADGKLTTAYWYDMIKNYDFSKNIYQPAAAPFSAMVWRSSTTVGFGVSGTHVVALYCDTRGNDEGRFACNVCRKGVGCDAASCPLPQTVCSSSDGQGNAEISLTADKASMRIIATVKRGQVFTLSLGTASLVDSDLLVFTAGTTAALSTVEDARATQAGAKPVKDAQSAVQAPRITEIAGAFIRFDLTRALSPGLANHYDFRKGRTHAMGWGQYRTNDFAARSDAGTCSLSLSDLAKETSSLCPASKKNSQTDPNRQKDCSPKLTQTCYDSTTYTFSNAKCPADSSCARWIETAPTGGAFYLDGCLLSQYCGSTGNYKGRTVQFECPNPRTPTQPTQPT
jgi:hypothetical protein